MKIGKKILKVILLDEELSPNVNIDEISNLTEGFSGSDLKNLCIAAAYQSIRDFLKKEKNLKKRKNQNEDNQEINKARKLENQIIPINSSSMDIVKLDENNTKKDEKIDTKEDEKIETENKNQNTTLQPIEIDDKIETENKNTTLRPLEIDDFTKALNEISASVSENAFAISELRRWNEMYGEGGKRRKPTLTYFG